MSSIVASRAYRYLCQIRHYDVLIRQQEQEIANLRAQAEYRGQSSGERVQTSAAGDTLAAYAARIVDAEAKLIEDKQRLLLLREQIVHDIQSLPDRRHSDLLYRRYVEGKSFKRIAAEMIYSYEYIRNHLHPAALRSMDSLLRQR